MSQENQEDLQHKFMIYQLLNQRLEEIKGQLNLIQQKMVELETTNHALSEMVNAKKDSEVLIPLGSGIYTFGKISGTEKLLVDLGASVMAKKDLNDGKKSIEEKKKEVEGAGENLQKEAAAIVNKMNELGEELQKAVAEHEQEQKEGAG